MRSPHLRSRVVTIIACLLGMIACAPAHNVKPLPNFVEAALQPGDKVIVITKGGETVEFVITEIDGDVLKGADYEVALEDVEKLQKVAWSRPVSPCGGEHPLGCSLPVLVRLLSESHEHYRDVFYDACAQHDYCYRHGFRSYGTNRDACDEEFIENMRASCPAPAENVLTKTLELLDDSVGSRTVCLSVADDYYAAVRRYGEDKFLTNTSTYCEYDGPPTGLGN